MVQAVGKNVYKNYTETRGLSDGRRKRLSLDRVNLNKRGLHEEKNKDYCQC